MVKINRRVRLVPALLFLLGSTLSAASLPTQQYESCPAAIAAVERHMQSRWGLAVRSTVAAAPEGFPTGRDRGVEFVVSGENVPDFFENAPLPAWSEMLVRQCSRVSAVSVGEDRTGFSVTLGLSRAGSMDFFECVEPGEPIPGWGWQYCGL